MGRSAHRPCSLCFAHLRVRLTKPPQIAGQTGRGSARPAAGVLLAAAPRPAAIGAGFARLAAGRTRLRPADARGRRSRGRRRAAGHESRLGKGPEAPKGKKWSRIPVGEGCGPPFPRFHPSPTGIRDHFSTPEGAPAPRQEVGARRCRRARARQLAGARGSGARPACGRRQEPAPTAAGRAACGPGARSGGPSARVRRRPGQNTLSLEGGIMENRPPWSKPASTGGKPPRSTRKPAPPAARAFPALYKTPVQEAVLSRVVKTGVFCTYSEGGF